MRFLRTGLPHWRTGFQFEGGYDADGRGLTTHDFETDGSLASPRAITYEMPDGTLGRAKSSFFDPDSLPEGARPILLAEHYDGWSSRKTIDCYLKYCRVLFERFGKRCKYWLTFNEINAVRGFAACGTHQCDNQTHYNAVHNMFLASAEAVRLGHEMMPGSMFGAMYALSELYPATCKPEDVFTRLQKRRGSYHFVDTMVRGAYPAYARSLLEKRGAAAQTRKNRRAAKGQLSDPFYFDFAPLAGAAFWLLHAVISFSSCLCPAFSC